MRDKMKTKIVNTNKIILNKCNFFGSKNKVSITIGLLDIEKHNFLSFFQVCVIT